MPAGVAGMAAVGRPRRRWLWAGLWTLMGVSLVAGLFLRVGLRDRGGPGLVAVGVVALAAALFLAGEVLVVLQDVQAREAAAEALGALPPGFRVTGRVRIAGAGPRPVVVDSVVVTPDGRAYAVVVDGSTRPPAPHDPYDGVGPLLPRARAAAEALAAAARARVLPARVGLGPTAEVLPCVLVVRRPFRGGPRDGVLAVGPRDLPEALSAPRPPTPA